MNLLEAIILGVVEGLTEFLPVSSTGHLILTKAFLGLDDSVDSYLVGIQLGAILAVAIYYRERVLEMLRGLVTRGPEGMAGRVLAGKLVLAFIPAAVVGLTLDDFIEEKFFNPQTVALALIVGGILMIVIERGTKPDQAPKKELADVTWRDAFLVGCAQCFALWPGMSRSMSTMVGGQLCRFTNGLAADFSFLLALPTLGAATTYSLLKDYETILEMENGLVNASVGIVVAFVVAWAAVAWFLKFLKKTGMTPFGIYRIIVGAVILVLASKSFFG